MPGTSAYTTAITGGGSTSVANGSAAPGSSTNYDFLDFGDAVQPKISTDFAVSSTCRGQSFGAARDNLRRS